MSARTEQIAAMQVTLAKVTDEAQRKDIITKIAALAKAEIEERKAAPPYPVGLTARFGKRTAHITGARCDAGGWVFDIQLEAGEFLGLGDGAYTVTEEKLREHLQGELGPMRPGQLFPQGIAMQKGGGAWVIIEAAGVTPAGLMYRVRGMGEPVSQEWVQGYLRG